MYRPAPDSGSEVDGLESFIQSVSVRVEYFRSLEYCVKWKKSMYPQRSSRPRRPSEKNPLRSSSPEEEEDVKLRGRRRRAGQRTTNASRGVVNTDEGSNRDMIDAIDDAQYGKRGAEEEEADGKFVEVADKGVDESDEDCDSVNSSICSGPSILHPTTHNTRVPSQNLCSPCREMYKKAKATRAPIKDKLLDNDPKSLTCDQWVLIKKWRPRRRPDARGNLLIHVKLVKKRLRKGVTQIEQNKRESESLACSRLHTFLRRRCVQAPVKKERKMNKRRKRPRDDSQGTRVAKQQRLHGHSRRQSNSKGRAHDGDIHPTSSRSRSSSPATETCSDQKIDNQADTCVTKLIPCTVNLEKMEAKDPPSRPKTPKMSSGFRGLLAQLRNNSSMIVKETH
ncbi:uncharacterized protein si:ch211-227n13.3 isoform X2 [Scophthalmus maximus]|uniref:uncharacterized protein si:ch211-227n13.3 isoform X2 n=1 Tax=Scophthalmus maximus TaxID=52904 RepID=UPI0015E13ACE|nr:uncharacterized protein si:ch211-227n13.3 isoform X2 [Scophthalmus maximus]